MSYRLFALGLVVTMNGVACANGSTALSCVTDSAVRPVQKGYSEAEAAAIFPRPNTARQLLENIKLAVDKDLLAQPDFVSDASLLRFFNGHSLRREAAKPSCTAFDQQDVFIKVDQRDFPQMTVRFRQGVVRIVNQDSPKGQIQTRNKRFAFVEMDVAAVKGFTVGEVRNVFGKETEAPIHDEAASDGAVAVRTAKGRLIYKYPKDPASVPSPSELKGVTFGIKLPAPGSKEFMDPPRPQDLAFYDTDEVGKLFIYVPAP